MTRKADHLKVYRSYLRLPPMPGGMEKHIASLSAAQREPGVDVVNIHNSGAANGAAVPVLPAFDLSRIRPNALASSLFYAAAMARIDRTDEAGDHVLHVHGDWCDFLWSAALARRIGVRTRAASLHAPATQRDAVYRHALRKIDPIFATGWRDKLHLENILQRPVHHLPSAPHDLFFQPETMDAERRSGSTCDVVSVGSLISRKRADILIDVAARRPGLKFRLIGDGPLAERLKSRIAANRLTNVELAGHADAPAVARALRGARLFLSVSEQEGTPTAALEAMACGLPVVLTPSNDYSWLIENGVNGFLTRGWEIDEILSRVDACLADDSQRRQMGRDNRALALQHRWSAKAERVTQLMREAVARTR